MITCPRCGYQAPDGTPYCPRCGYGRPVPQIQIPSGSAPDYMITCPKCGLKLPPGSRFCSRCGYQIPVDQPAKKKVDKGSRLMLVISLSLMAYCLFSYIFDLNKPKSNPAKPPTMSANQIAAAAHETAEVLRQKTEAPKLTKTAEYLLTPTRTPEPTLPPLCQDRQMDIVKIANVLDAQGSPYPEKYNPASNSCIYWISKSKGLFDIDSYGYLTIIYDENNIPDSAIVEMSYKDNVETIENITDWGAIALAYIDDSQNPLTASATIKAIQMTGVGETENCTIAAGFEEDNMTYRFSIIKGTGLLDALQQIFESEE